MAATLDKARSRSLMTDFERTIQDVSARRMERLTNDLPQILLNIDLKGSVVGDRGIQEMLSRVVKDLNRQSQLVTAGA